MTLEERYGSPNKPVNGKSAEESRQIVADYESTHPEFKGYAQNLRNYWNEFTKTWLLDTGMIDSEGYARLQEMYPDYVPTYRKDKGGAGGGGIVFFVVFIFLFGIFNRPFCNLSHFLSAFRNFLLFVLVTSFAF